MTPLHTAGTLVLVAVLGVTGCSAKGGTTTPEQPTATVTGASRNQPEGAAKDLSGVVCKADKNGVWSLQATLKNASDSESTYTIRASVVKKAGSTVVGSKEVTRTLEAGKSEKVVIEKITKQQDSKNLLCVPTTTVERRDG